MNHLESALYDRIGTSYGATRREEPRFAALINEALGDARSVVNVGAGAGAYEPKNREVVAVEPSDRTTFSSHLHWQTTWKRPDTFKASAASAAARSPP